MKRTVSITVDLPSERFLPLMNQCAEIFNAHIDWAMANSTYNKSKAHKELYHLLRVQHPSVPSALLQTVRDNALEAIKAQSSRRGRFHAADFATKFKSVPKKKPTSGLRYDKRTMTLRGKQLTLSCIGKRVTLILDVPEYFQEVFESWDFCGATVTYTKNTRQFWVRLVFETEDPQQIEGQIQGIDRGLYHQAVTSDGQFFSSSKIRKVQRRYLYNRRKLQQKGTRSAKRRLKALFYPRDGRAGVSQYTKRFDRFFRLVTSPIRLSVGQFDRKIGGNTKRNGVEQGSYL
ncbi:hypothetical protein VB735_03850 [Halotia wernerae UHCC 0503]|nr:hypothetical protein [Halotia wernerae UHCC 0503]